MAQRLLAFAHREASPTAPHPQYGRSSEAPCLAAKAAVQGSHCTQSDHAGASLTHTACFCWRVKHHMLIDIPARALCSWQRAGPCALRCTHAPLAPSMQPLLHARACKWHPRLVGPVTAAPAAITRGAWGVRARTHARQSASSALHIHTCAQRVAANACCSSLPHTAIAAHGHVPGARHHVMDARCQVQRCACLPLP